LARGKVETLLPVEVDLSRFFVVINKEIRDRFEEMKQFFNASLNRFKASVRKEMDRAAQTVSRLDRKMLGIEDNVTAIQGDVTAIEGDVTAIQDIMQIGKAVEPEEVAEEEVVLMTPSGAATTTTTTTTTAETIEEASVRLKKFGKMKLVQVFHNKAWGFVNYKGWKRAYGDVICRSLGYGSQASVSGMAGRNLHVSVDDVNCDGSEANLRECPIKWGHADCRAVEGCSVVDIDCSY